MEFIKNAQDSGEMLALMINNLLDCKKIESGHLELY